MSDPVGMHLARYIAGGWQIVSRTDREVVLARSGSLLRRGRTLRLVMDRRGRLRPADDAPGWAKALGTVVAGFVMLWALASCSSNFSRPPDMGQQEQSSSSVREARSSASKPASLPNYDTLSNAWEACQTYVRQRLKAPSTAKFPWIWDVGYKTVQAEDGGTRWILSAYVTAENDFGARRRVDFFCAVRHVGNNRWALESMSMGDPY